MYRLRNWAILAGLLCFGLSPAVADHHEMGDEGQHMGPPSAPESLRPIFQEAIDSGDLSEQAESILLFLNLPPEGREGTEPPRPEEGEGKDVKEQLTGLFKDILEGGDLPEDAAHYLEMMLERMDDEGEHMGGCDGCGGQGQGMGTMKPKMKQKVKQKMQEQMGGDGHRAELPEEVREQLQAIRGMYSEVMEIERDIRRSDGEPSEDVLATRNDLAQEIVNSVVDLLGDVEVDSENAPMILRLLGPSFGPMRGQGGQGDMGG